MIIKILLVLLLISPSFLGQKPLEPTRIAFFQEEKPYDQELNRLVLIELRRMSDVIVTGVRPDYEARVAVMRVTSEGGCAGYVAASLVVEKSSGAHSLTVHTAGELKALARELAAYLDREYFRIKRRK